MLEEGDQIRDYRLRRFLGQGSYGEVWLAERRIELADDCLSFALKFLTDQSDRGGNTGGLNNEIRTWIKAGSHFNIVPVYDGFIHGRFLVIVSEYVEGGSLRDWLVASNKKAPALEKAVDMMRGILRGLTHLHSRKIIHRDLKPENILLKDGDPKITDFGVSRMVETFSQSAVLRNTKGAGAPLYMPPEAFSDGRPTPQLDTWSAGVMFYEMLSGELPFNADSLPVLLGEITNKEPKPLPPNVPEELQEFVSISLAKDVSRRFQTSEQMSESLEKVWAEMEERRKWRLETIGKDVLLERNGVRREADDLRELETKRMDKAPKEAEDARRDEVQTNEPRPRAVNKLTWVGIAVLVLGAIVGGAIWLSIRQPNAAALFSRGKECYEKQDYDCAVENYTKALDLNPQSAESYYSRGRAYNKKRDYDHGIIDLTKAIELNPLYAEAYTYRGAAYGAKGNPDEAIKDLNRAIELNPQFADAFFNRGIADRDKGNREQAIKDLDKAIELNPQYANAYYERAITYDIEGDRDRSIKDYNKAIELNSQYYEAYYNRAITNDIEGNRDSAIKYFNKAIELNSQSANSYNGRGAAYLFAGNIDQAIKDLDRALDLNSKLAPAYYFRGLAYGNKGNHDQAMRDFSMAIELDPEMAEAYAYRGSSYSNKGDFVQALRDFDKAIELNPKMAEAYYNRGQTYGNSGNHEQAMKDFSKAIELNPQYTLAYYGRAVAYGNLGQVAKATADARKYKELSTVRPKNWTGN